MIRGVERGTNAKEGVIQPAMDKPKVLHLIRKWLHPMDVFICIRCSSQSGTILWFCAIAG